MTYVPAAEGSGSGPAPTVLSVSPGVVLVGFEGAVLSLSGVGGDDGVDGVSVGGGMIVRGGGGGGVRAVVEGGDINWSHVVPESVNIGEVDNA